MTRCKQCNQRLESELTLSAYLGLCAASTVLAMVPGILVLAALVTGQYVVAIGIAGVLLTPLVLLGMFLHAQHLTIP
jgi:hypothetical protein